MTIINFMPVYRQAPVSLRLLEERLDEAVERAASEDVTLILPKGRTDLASRFGEGKVVLADETIGFLYGNDTAAAKLLSGEKPVPSSVTGAAEDEVVSGEAWLCGQDGTKRVWLEGANDPVEVDATTTVAGLLSVAAVPTEGLRAVYLGYPQSRFLVPGELDEPMELSCDYMCVYTDANCMANALREIATGSAVGAASLATRAAISSKRSWVTRWGRGAAWTTSTSCATSARPCPPSRSASWGASWRVPCKRASTSLATSSIGTSARGAALRASARRS